MKSRGLRRQHSYHTSDQDETITHLLNPEWAPYEIRVTSSNNRISIAVYLDGQPVLDKAFDAGIRPSNSL